MAQRSTHLCCYLQKVKNTTVRETENKNNVLKSLTVVISTTFNLDTVSKIITTPNTKLGGGTAN